MVNCYTQLYRAENCTVVYQYTQDGLIIEVVSLERMEQRIQQKKDQNVKKVSTWCVKTGITEMKNSHHLEAGSKGPEETFKWSRN